MPSFILPKTEDERLFHDRLDMFDDRRYNHPARFILQDGSARAISPWPATEIPIMVDSMVAARQWASRPADERFETVQDLHDFALRKRHSSRAATVPWSGLRVTPTEQGGLLLNGSTGTKAEFMNWSWNQICRKASMPAEFLSTLPAPMAAEVATTCLARIGQGEDETPNARILLSSGADDAYTLRSATSERYSRIWDVDLTSRLLRLRSMGWQVPPARPAGIQGEKTRLATEEDVIAGMEGGVQIRVGDPIAPAGLYASDRDFFAIMIDRQRPVDDGNGKPLFKMLMAMNSEVGAKTFTLCAGLLAGVCGNHILWGIQQVLEVSMRHIGQAANRAGDEFETAIQAYTRDTDGHLQAEGAIRKARGTMLGHDKESILDRLFGLRIFGLTKTVAVKAYAIAEEKESIYGSPASTWGIANGMTEYSQTLGHQDARHVIDTAAGKLLEVEF